MPFHGTARRRERVKWKAFAQRLSVRHDGPSDHPMITLAHGLRFADLYSIEGARRIDGLFLDHLRAADAGLAGKLDAGRSAPESLEAKAEAAMLIALGPHLEDFLAQLFGIAPEGQALESIHH